MVLEFKFPDTGEGVTEGKFLEWLVEEGEEIDEDQVVGEAETDKAVIDIPSPADGTIKELKAEPGDNVKVGDVIMILETGETSEQEEESESSEEQEETETEAPEETEEPEKDNEVEIEAPEPEKEEADTETSTTSSGNVLALPKVRKLAEEKGVNLASIKTGERITEEEVLEAADGSTVKTDTDKKQDRPEPEETEEKPEENVEIPDTSDVNAMPSVRKLAREKGVNIASIDGSGRGGKITREDVLNADESARTEKTENKTTTTSSPDQKEERIEMSGIKQMTAEKMKESKFSAPHVTHVDKADVTRLVELREEEKDDLDVHLTYLPFIMKATALALKEYPELNAELDEENNEIILKNHYDFNMAVDTDKGLLVPLIEEVDQKNIIELAEEIGDIAGKAKHSELSPDEMRNGTFSATNLGVIGGEEFTPIINYPQTAILGVGKIQQTPEVVDGEIVPRHTVKLSVSYDHRVVDGATAARFTNKIIENLEDPGKMLIEL